MDNQQLDQQTTSRFAQAPAQKKSSLITAIFAILAIAGVSFGVFEMLRCGDEPKASDFKISVANADGTVSALDANKVEIKDNEIIVKQAEEIASSTTGGPYMDSEYFYVPKWGVKYKLPANAVNFGFAVDQNSQSDSYGNYVVGVSAILKEDYEEEPQDRYYDDIFSCSVVTVRTLEESKSGWNMGKFDVELNNHKFVIHDTWRQSLPDICEFPESADKAAPILIEMLKNPELM